MTNIQIKRFIEKIKAGDLIESTYIHETQKGNSPATTKAIFLVMKKPYLIRNHYKTFQESQENNSDFKIDTIIDIYVIQSNKQQDSFQRLSFTNIRTLSMEKIEYYKNYSLRLLCSASNAHSSKKIGFKKGSSKKNLSV